MLAYAHINLKSMLKRFHPDEVVRVATDSLYIQKSASRKLEGVETYVPRASVKGVRGVLQPDRSEAGEAGAVAR